MSAEESQAVILRFNQAMKEYWRTGNAGLFDDVIAPTYIQHWPGFPSDRQGYLDTLAIFRAAFPDLKKTSEALFAHEDLVFDRVTVRCTHTGDFKGIPATGNAVTLTEMHVARVDQGMILERWGEWDQLGLLQQIGALPADQQ